MAVAVVQGGAGSLGGAMREGAGEFAVMLRIAQLRRSHDLVGIVGVGDHNGVLRSGGELALRRAALSGVVVVKLAPNGAVAPGDHEFFLDGGRLSEVSARQILGDCLSRLGAPPSVADLDAPTAAEHAAIRAHLEAFRVAFAEAVNRQAVQNS